MSERAKLTVRTLLNPFFTLIKISLYWTIASSSIPPFVFAPSQTWTMLRSVLEFVSHGDRKYNKNCNYLSPELWLTQTLLELYLLVAFDQTYPQGGGDKVLGFSFHTLYHVLSGNDSLDVLGDSGVGSCTGSVRDRKQVRAKNNQPMPFLSIKLTKSASVRRLGFVV